MTTLDELLADEGYPVRRTIDVLSRVLGAAAEKRRRTIDDILTDHLGAPRHERTTYHMRLGVSTVLAAGLVLTDLIRDFDPQIAPDADNDPPRWTDQRVGSDDYTFPTYVTLLFDAGELSPVPIAVHSAMAIGYPHSYLTVVAPPDARDEARAVVAELRQRIFDRNPLRGRILRAADGGGLQLSVVDDLQADRAQVMVPSRVWEEIDLAIGAVTTRHTLLAAAGLPTSRGVMLAGPPGVGKTAVVRSVAAEMAGEFTVIIADASAATYGITALYDQAADLGPLVVVLDDIDLYIRRRGDGNDSQLGALLAALDGAAKLDRVLTIATTNDPRALDAAATRAARFDSVIELGPPSDLAAAAILRKLLEPLPTAGIDMDRVVAALPADRSGADISEVVRRSILIAGAEVTTATLLSVIGAHDYEAALPVGAYL